MRAFNNSLGVKPRLNVVKASGGCLRFFNGILSSELDKNPGTNSASEFDIPLEFHQFQ